MDCIWDSSVSRAIRLWGGGVRFRASTSTSPQPPEWLWCPPSQWTLIALFLGIKWPVPKADYSPVHKNASFLQVQ